METPTNRNPNSLDNKLESSAIMEVDEKEDQSWDFLQSLGTNSVSHSNASLIHGHESPKNTVIDHKNKGVCTDPPCFITPLYSDKIDTSCCIHEKGEPSSRFCVICNDRKPARELQESGNCEHRFCIDCVRSYLIENVKESGLPVKCSEKGCNEDLPDDDDFLTKFIPQEMVDRYYDYEREAKVLECPYYIMCPFDDCRSFFVDDMKDYMIRACPKCWKIFCMKCRKQWHMGRVCDQFVLRLNKKKSFDIDRLDRYFQSIYDSEF